MEAQAGLEKMLVSESKKSRKTANIKYSELPIYITGKDIISYTGNVAHQSYSLFKTTVTDHSSKRINKADVLCSFQNETLLFGMVQITLVNIGLH